MIRISSADVRNPPMFPPIHIPASSGVSLQTMRGRLGFGDAVQLQLTGSAVRDYYDDILAIAVRDIANGAPRKSLSDYRDAVVNSGQLITLEVREGTWSSEDGIIQVLSATVGPGGPFVVELTLLFWPVHTIYYQGLGPDDRQSVMP